MNPITKIDAEGNSITIREYDSNKDAASGFRIMREVRWVEKDDDPKYVDRVCTAGRALVGEVNGFVECITSSAEGTIRYLEEDLRLSAVTGVTTGLGARRRGLALDLTARLVAEDAAEGAEVAVLGVFDQGFYDKIGFGSGACEIKVSCDLADMRGGRARPAIRLTQDDWKEIHNAMLKRKLWHGSCNLLPEEIMEAKIKLIPSETYFGLGYRDGPNGELTHFILGELDDENGPLNVERMAWRDISQLKELIALLSSLGDQIWVAKFTQPRYVQIHDLIERPLKRPLTTSGGKYSVNSTTYPIWQVRILDLVNCLARTRLPSSSFAEFNLHLTDPILQRLPADVQWRGIEGEWTVGIGKESYAKPGFSKGLPTMKASSGAFTRLWLGVASPTALSITDNLSASTELLEELDSLLKLPTPIRDWDF